MRASVVKLGTPIGFAWLGNLLNAFTIKWDLNFEIIIQNNNNHLVILPKIYGLLIKYIKTMWST
jgi:hypothetical protein